MKIFASVTAKRFTTFWWRAFRRSRLISWSTGSRTSITAQRAVLAYRTLKRAGDLTLLEVDLETGRYHQIRVQLSTLGTPIAGDEKYGAKQRSKYKDIALHARQLEITHPTLKEPVVIAAPYSEVSKWWKKLT